MSEKEQVVVVSSDEFRNRAISESLSAAADLNLDLTRPGGAYVVGDVLVDANGAEIKDEQGSVEAKVEEARRLLAEVQASQQVDVTGLPNNEIPEGVDAEPFLSQMQVPIDREELAEQEASEDEATGGDGEDYQDRSMADLRDEATGRGIDLSGVRSKSDLIERMVAADAQEQNEES
jgi:hypothetical protein